MAGRMLDDHPASSANGAHAAPQGSTAQPAEAGGTDQTLADQSLADRDQTHADSDQTASDSDQTTADNDQAAAELDQAAADSDQIASDLALAQGGDRDDHDRARDARARSAQQRREAAQLRVETAAARDAIARARDLEALARDEAAATRDRELAARERAWGVDGPPESDEAIEERAVAYRRLAAADRAAAHETRTRAAADREQAARDRLQAARDRVQAKLDRDGLLRQLALAETDELTGARTRAAGLADFAHEIDRARRGSGHLAVGYVDVVGLKSVNDARGHSAGDALLQRAVRAIRDQLRPYDLIVRLGGDEFLCVMCEATMKTVEDRFKAVQAELAANPEPCAIRVGVAELEPNDGATELIERADAALPTGRRS